MLERDGWIEKGSLRVVGDKTGGDFPCQRSTALYPDIVFASLERAPAAVVRNVTVTLLSMPTSSSYEWSVASNFLSVSELIRKLEIGHYAHLHEWTWSSIWFRYKEKILVVVGYQRGTKQPSHGECCTAQEGDERVMRCVYSGDAGVVRSV